MSESQATIAALWVQAAFASSWPTLCAYYPDESSMLSQLNILVERLGPLPQADIIEPYDGEQWELRVTVPSLSPDGWLRLSADRELVGLTLRPGCPTGARFALDCAELDFEEGPGLARRSFLDDSEQRRILMRGREPDEVTRELEQELVTAYRRVEPGLYMESDRGMDTAEIVLEPCSGRFGLRLCFPAEALDCLDDIEAGREGIFRELEAVILKRAEHSIVRLWPRIEWTSTSGLQLCLWILGAAAPIYPGELPEASVSFVPRLLANVQRELEVQLVPRSEAAHQPLAEAAGEVIFSADYKLTGSWPRWITGPNGERRFSLSWWFDAEHLGEAEALLSWASGREDVLLARVVPRSAPILESDWRQLDPIWYAGEQRAFVVCRELWTGRDRALAVQPRLPEGAEIGLLGMPYPDSVQRLQPVIGVDERQGMLWRLSPKVWDTGSLLRLLHYFDEMPEDILGGIVDMGFDLEGGWAVGWSPDEILSRAHHKEYRIS